MNIDGNNKEIITDPIQLKKSTPPSQISKLDQKIANIAQEIQSKRIHFRDQADFRTIEGREIKDNKYDMPKMSSQDELEYIKSRVEYLKEEVRDGVYLNDESQTFLEDGEAFLAKSKEETMEIPQHLRKENQSFNDKLALPGVSMKKKAKSTSITTNRELTDDIKRNLDNELVKAFARLDSKGELFADKVALLKDIFINQSLKEEPITKEELRDLFLSFTLDKEPMRTLPQKDGEIDDEAIAKQLSKDLGAKIDLTEMKMTHPGYSKEMITAYLKELPLEEKIVDFMINKGRGR